MLQTLVPGGKDIDLVYISREIGLLKPPILHLLPGINTVST
jgi:hypothetical protein